MVEQKRLDRPDKDKIKRGGLFTRKPYKPLTEDGITRVEPKPDRPELREKIANLIKDNTRFTEGEYSPLAGPITSDLTELMTSPKELAKQILALIIPDIEEAKKREKERIGNAGKHQYIKGYGYFTIPWGEWQALGEE